MQFGSHDFWLTQHQKTMAYAKALQYLAEKANPHQLAGCGLELCTMEPLTTFTNEEVLEDILPPIRWTQHLDQWSLPKENTAATGPTELMLEDHSWQPMVRDSHKPQPPPRWQANKPLQPRRSCHDRQVPTANAQHPHQGLQRSLNPCMGITHQGGPCVLTWWHVPWTWWAWDLIPQQMTATSPLSKKQQIWTRYPTCLSVIVCHSLAMLNCSHSGVFTLMCFICFVFSLNISYIPISLTNYVNGSILLMNTGEILFH